MSQIDNVNHIQIRKSHDQDKYKNVPKPYMQVAEGMEAQFTNHLLTEMRKSIGKKSSSSAENVYNSMLDRERATIMAKTNTGLGIKDLVLKDIYPQFEQQNLNKPENKFEKIKMYKNIHSQKGEIE